jgi:hypothetical protein
MEDVMREEELDSDDYLSAALLRGLALEQRGRCEDALHVFEEATEMHGKTTSHHWYALSMMYAETATMMALKDKKKARHCARLAGNYSDDVLLRRLVMKRQEMCRMVLSGDE